MTETAYAMVAQIRRRELRTRLALAGFIAATAWFVAPGIWPAIWLTLVVGSQILDLIVFDWFLRHPEREPGRTRVAFAVAVTAGCVVIYSGIAGYLWFFGGDIGRVFALIQVAGGLLHVSLHMHRARPVLAAAVATHGAYFLGLPVISAITGGRWQELLITIGCLLYMSHLVVAVRQSNLTTGLLQSARDAAREAQHKAEVANAAKSDFLAVISHEIRTPMNAVISAANLLRRTELSPAQREHVAMLTDAGDVLMGLLNDVLDFSKIEAGKMELESAVVDVRERLTALCRLWEPRAAAAGVSLSMEVDDDVPQAVRTDPLRFQQILFNLMSNAVKFTGEGEIRVRTSWCEGRLSVAVIDTGCGIPADRLPHVFNSFEQADAGTTRRYGGTGLGLSISRKLARIMGGDLAVESLEGVGSTFTLELPLEVAAAPTGDSAVGVGEGAGLRGRSILAADDHEVNRRILALLLEPHGCRLTLVANGAEAVEAATLEPFDAVLMDMQMPVMDGLEAARRIRDGGVNATTPIIALTANAMETHKAAWDGIGVAAFLTKPIDPVLLAEALAAACALRDEPAADAAA